MPDISLGTESITGNECHWERRVRKLPGNECLIPWDTTIAAQHGSIWQYIYLNSIVPSFHAWDTSTL